MNAQRVSTTGNPEGNGRFTAMLGDLILPLFIVTFVAGLGAKSGLLSTHVAIGLGLACFVVVKVASVTYRLAAYYRGVSTYRRRGRPATSLRLLGGSLGILMALLLGSGLVLLIGPGSLHSVTSAVHKVSAYLAVVALLLHLIAHLRDSLLVGTGDLRRRALTVPGARARWTLLATTIVVGGILALALTGHAASYAHRYYPRVGASVSASNASLHPVTRSATASTVP